VRIEIQVPDVLSAGEECPVRATLFNDSYQPVEVSRNSFIGPSLSGPPDGTPGLLAVEPSYGGPEELFTLHPFSFYGRERALGPLVAGSAEITASYRDSTGDVITATKRVRVEPARAQREHEP
jgi:hypothetical protein